MKKLVASDMSLATSWRSGRDSNPRAVARKLISSQPRYDHFDTAAWRQAALPAVRNRILYFYVLVNIARRQKIRYNNANAARATGYGIVRTEADGKERYGRAEAAHTQ